jgi:hypothetical protein
MCTDTCRGSSQDAWADASGIAERFHSRVTHGDAESSCPSSDIGKARVHSRIAVEGMKTATLQHLTHDDDDAAGPDTTGWISAACTPAAVHRGF